VAFLRPIWLVAILAALALAANPKAEQLAKEAATAEKSGETVKAYLLWAQAAAADRQNVSYWARASALRARAEAISGTHVDAPELTWSSEKPPVGTPVSTTFTEQDLDDLKRMSPPPRLRPSLLKGTFHLKANAKTLFEKVAAEYGYVVIFDKDYNPNGDARFDVTDLPYREALHALEDATNSFIVPISETAMMVALDTPQKRTELENDEAISIPIPQRSSIQEAQELLTLVQQAFEIRRAVLDPQRRMVFLRDRVSKVESALAVMNQLQTGKPQVSIEVELLSTSASSSLSFGMTLPTQFPLVHFGDLLHSTPYIPAGFMRFLTFGGGATFFGIGLTDAKLFATASRSSANSLMRTTILASDGQAATLHVGNKYPIISSGYMGPGGFTNGGGGGGGGVTFAVISTTPYAADLVSSAVSTTGSMTLLVNGLAVPIILPAAANNVAGLQSVINSLQAGVYATTVERGTQDKPISLVLVASSLSVTSIQLIDDPTGAKIELVRPPNVVSSISGDFTNSTTTTVSAKGDLNLTVGGNSFPLTLASDQNNLNGLRDAINAAGAGVTASVLLSNIVTGTVFLQVVAQSADSGAIQIYDDPSGTNTSLLTATDEVNLAGSQFGQSVAGSTGSVGSDFGLYPPMPTFNFEDLGLSLKVTPFVHSLDEVTLEIEIEFKMLGAGSLNGVPVIANRKYQGKIRLQTSEWAIVAGLLDETKTNSVSGIPGLKDIPGLGLLLRENNKSSDKNNVLVVIKPRVTSLPGSEYAGRPIWVGSETRPLSPL
jgi:general secretion pathway protein D